MPKIEIKLNDNYSWDIFYPRELSGGFAISRKEALVEIQQALIDMQKLAHEALHEFCMKERIAAGFAGEEALKVEIAEVNQAKKERK